MVSFFIASNDASRAERQQREVLKALLPSEEAFEKIGEFFYQKTRSLMHSKAFSLSDKGVMNVDVVRDVLRFVPLHWAATEIVRKCNFFMGTCMLRRQLRRLASHSRPVQTHLECIPRRNCTACCLTSTRTLSCLPFIRNLLTFDFQVSLLGLRLVKSTSPRATCTQEYQGFEGTDPGQSHLDEPRKISWRHPNGLFG